MLLWSWHLVSATDIDGLPSSEQVPVEVAMQCKRPVTFTVTIWATSSRLGLSHALSVDISER